MCPPAQPLQASTPDKRPVKRRYSTLRKRYKEELEEIWNWRPPQCCNKNCCLQLGAERCRCLRKDFYSSSQKRRKEMLLDFRAGVVGNKATEIQIDGVCVCTKFLKSVLNVSNTLRSNVLQLPSANSSHLPGRVRSGNTSESKQIGVIAFLNTLVHELGDCMPHAAERHLPHKSKKLVYLLYYDSEISSGRNAARPSTFYEIWKRHLPHIKCIRSHTFETCDTCIAFRDNQRLMIKGQLAGKTKASMVSSFNKHIHGIKLERAEYRRVRQMAGDKPGEVLSVIIDGADQAKFGLPRFVDKSKGERGYALKQKVTGVLFHHGVGASDFFCVFTSRENIPGGANQTVDVLVRGLFRLIKRRGLYDSFQTHAKELFIQLDNTVKDNKNRFFFAFCEHLVFLGIFKRVTVNFLPVGHTHEDIDRKFSRISVKLKQENVVTVSELHTAIRGSERWAIEPAVTRVKGHLNYSSCLKEQSCVVKDKMGITSYRKFVFERRGVEMTVSGERYHVLCKVGGSMITLDHEMKTLPNPNGNVGCFLTKVPDMTKVPSTSLQTISIQDAEKHRMRLRSTECRIRCQVKTLSVMNEIDDLQLISHTNGEWQFSELERLHGVADLSDECEATSDGEIPDGLSYEIGEIITVRVSRDEFSVTPFWLGSIVDVKTDPCSSACLTVRWYKLKLQARGTRRGHDCCFEGQYMPCAENAASSYDDIPSESVLCAFESLSRTGCIPLRAQQRTRQAILDCMEATEVRDPFSYGEEQKNGLSEEETDLTGDTAQGDDNVDMSIDFPFRESDATRERKKLASLRAENNLVCNQMITVGCADQEVSPFRLGQITSMPSGSQQNLKVKWYTPPKPVKSDDDYYKCVFNPDSTSPITSVSKDTVITSFRSLTKGLRIPKKAQSEIRRMLPSRVRLE